MLSDVSNGETSIPLVYKNLTNVTGEICSFFGAHGPYNIFFSENRGFPSYDSIEGKNALPWEYKEGGYPISNLNRRDGLNAINECKKLGRKVLNLHPDEKITGIRRTYMLDGNTIPIKVTYQISSHLETVDKSIFVKKMNLSRLFLGTLYNLLIGRDFSQFFSESSIYEWEEVGPTLDDAYAESNGFFRNPQNRRDLVRLSAHAYFLSLSDVDYGWNVIKNPENGFVPIDFDQGFWFKIKHPLEELVNPIMNPLIFEENIGDYVEERVPMQKILRQFSPQEINEFTQDTFEEMYHNLRKRMKTFLGIIELMTRFDYYNIMSQRMYGAKDIKDYFLHRFEELK